MWEIQSYGCFIYTLRPQGKCMYQWTMLSLVQVMACHYLNQWWFVVNEIFRNKFQWHLNNNTIISFYSTGYIWKCCLLNDSHFVSGLNIFTTQWLRIAVVTRWDLCIDSYPAPTPWYQMGSNRVDSIDLRMNVKFIETRTYPLPLAFI